MSETVEVVKTDGDNGKDVLAEDEFVLEGNRDQVFSNSLVWRNLGKYLNFSDLKTLRLVCQEFNRNVMGETDFESRVVITLKGSKIEQEAFEPTTVWKHFRIHCFTYEDLYEDCEEDTCQDDETGEANEDHENTPDFEWLYLMISDAESLCISAKDIETDHGAIFPPLKDLLESATNLKKLEVDIQLVARSMHNGSMLLSAKAYNMLENLPELHIRKSSEYLLSAELEDLVTEEVTDEVIMRSIRPLTQLMTKLRVLTIENIVKERLSDLSKEMNYYKVKNVLKLITNNKNNLVKLDIDEVLLWYYPKIHSLQSRAITSHIFPQLKSLRIRTHQRDHSEMNQQNLITFLNGHANLEELEITITPRFPNAVLHALHNLTHLRRLCIKTKRFEQEELDLWSFLSRLTALKTLKIIVSRSFDYGQNSGTPVDIFISLPKSVQEVSLKGFPKLRYNNCDSNPSPSTCLRDVLQFDPTNITILKLRNCPSFVDDNLVKLICKFFRMVRFLDLSFNESITDFGLTGLTESEDSVSKYSLKDLKGLRHLYLTSCEQLTDICTPSIEFLELIFVDLSFNRKITTDGYLNVLRQNPSLEILKTDHTFPKDFSYEKNRFKSIEFQFGSRYDDSDDEVTDDSETDYSDQDFGDSDLDYDNDYGFNYFDSDEDDDPLVFIF